MFLQMYTIVFAQIRIHQTSAPPCSASACTGPRTCSRTRYMNKNLSSSLRLYLSLKIADSPQWYVDYRPLFFSSDRGPGILVGG